MTTTHILVVEDDKGVAQVLASMLLRSGYQPHLAHDGPTAHALIATQPFCVAILDLNLGKGEISGVDLLAVLRERSPQTAVILLTGYATLDSAIAAVRLGAHDYLLKPANMAQLRHSIAQALQKRAEADRQQTLLNQLEERLSHSLLEVRQALHGPTAAPPTVPTESRFLEHGGLIIDLARQVALFNDQPLDLTFIEYSLLAYLVRVAPHLATPQEMVAQIHGYSSDYDEASDLIRPHISRLRHKLRQAGADNMIGTIRGRGYVVNSDGPA
jgi:DNA-binding response OmpR family regulator